MNATTLPRWFVLFDGHSEDGLGPGRYAGRTDDPDVARAHHEKIRKSAYSTGYVRVMEDEREWCIYPYELWGLTKCRHV